MAKSQTRYTPEFRRQMVELHRAGRSFDELAKEFGCTSWSIRQWVKQADRDTGRGDGGLTTAEREELAGCGVRTASLKEEREILSKAAAWFAKEKHRDTEALFGFVKANQATFSVQGHVPFAQGFQERLLCLGRSAAVARGRVWTLASAPRFTRSIGALAAPMARRRSTPSLPTNTRRVLVVNVLRD